MKELIFATNNIHKLQEIRALLDGDFIIRSLAEVNCFDEIPETGNTLQANAEIKARYIVDKYRCNCFADDTGLEVDCLQGAPGVFSARYAGEDCNSEKNIDKLLLAMEGESNRLAQFRTVIALIENNELFLFEGIIKGRIANERFGTGGFGYDSVFIPEGYDKTFAELPAEVKNTISHRAIASKKLVAYLMSKNEK